MRAFALGRWLLPALVLPLCVTAVGVGVQALAFGRPPAESLVAARAAAALIGNPVMLGTERIGGRAPVTSACVEGWFRRRLRHRFVFGALALLGNGERLSDFGHGVHVFGRRRLAGQIDAARFLLAGCPSFLLARIDARLSKGPLLDADPAHADGNLAVAIRLGHRRSPIDLVVAQRTFRPVELELTGSAVHGSSDLHAGGGRKVIRRVFRAFRFSRRWQAFHA